MYKQQQDRSLEEDQRILLNRQGKTKIYALCTNQPWKLSFDALVVPVNLHGGFTRFGREFFSAFGDDTYKMLAAQFSKAVQSAMKEQHLKVTEPDKPLLIHLPDEINQKLSSNSEFIADRFIICVTVDLQGERTIANCITATKAVVRLAANQGLTRIVTPLIGGGVRNLKANEVAVAMRQALSMALTNEPNSELIKEITIADVQEDAINTLRASILETNEFLPQSPHNDLPSGKDLLNIEHEVHALAEVLLMRILEPPLAVGILGGWGSGKSYIMHLMRQKMTQIRSQPVNQAKAWGNLVNSNLDSEQEQLSPYVGHVYQITFDAWTYARSNLWASLMETIFFELNRQLTLEKQLQAANVSPYEGGRIWEALNEMSDRQRRELFYDAQLTDEQFKALQKLDSCREVEDLLWESLKTSREKEEEALQLKKIELEKEQKKLAETINQVRQEVEKEIVDKPEAEIIIEPIRDLILEEFIGKAFQQFKNEITQQIQEQEEQKNQKGTEWLEDEFTKFKTTRLITLDSLSHWISANWKILLAFIIFLLLTITIPFVLEKLKTGIIPQLAATLVPLTPGILAGQELVKKWRGYIDTISKKFDDYQKKVEKLAETERLKSAKIREEEIKKRLDTPEVRASEEKVKYLQADVEQQRQRVIEITQVSLQDFVSNQLENGLYGKRLGLMQQVKNDLATITEQLLPPKQSSDKFQQHIQRLQELFPRGPARVVLYIDDLDRCPPNRVVQVLEAVQLLVKTPLFVVVLAIDERYIARALEKVYEGVLHRKGKPSGIDYIEKIIQIPYRVRPIARSALKTYLEAQMQYESEVTENATQSQISSFGYQGQSEQIAFGMQQIERENIIQVADSFNEESFNEYKVIEDLPLQVIKFTKEEFDIVLECCQHVDLSPRTLKRLINVYKLFKIVWFRSSRLQDMEDDETTRKVIVSFLALSGRYPSLMRSVFEDLEMHFEELKELHRNVLEFFPQKTASNNDTYLHREWNRLRYDAETLGLGNLTLEQLGEDSFNMIRSFCFVGDIGYDPDDFTHSHPKLSLPD
jgi:predicted KAP-like P-loop ATPase